MSRRIPVRRAWWQWTILPSLAAWEVRGLRRRALRGRAARAIAAAGLLGLSLALFRLEVLDADAYRAQARSNRLRSVPVPAARGAVYDRAGRIVAANAVANEVLLLPAPADSLRAELRRLGSILRLSPAEIESVLRRGRAAPHLPVVVLQAAPADAIAALEERRFMLPDVVVLSYPARSYPAGDTDAHLVGYVAPIDERELATPEFREYAPSAIIGKTGLERAYEHTLAGRPGLRLLEIDARGRLHRWLPRALDVPPSPGRDLRLYLDLELQRYVARIFPRQYRGAFVALDPQTGGILALYSSPGYDPNLFATRISAQAWARLAGDSARPLLDRVTASAQPPASTWKPVVAALALQLGVLRPDEFMPIPCTGGLWYGGRYARCWSFPRGHGYRDLAGALQVSCDVYFYQVGLRIGLRRYLALGTRLGFAARTGVDLPDEASNSFPPSADWWRRRFGAPATEGEMLSLAIGQGPTTMTPLKMAQFYAALARGDGRAPAPRLVMGGAAPRDTLDLGITPADVEAIVRGLRRVLGPGGTAALSRLRGWDFVGKTGTAEVAHGRSHAWFAGFGGRFGQRPDIVAVLFLEAAEHGYAASTYVADAIDFFLSPKYGRAPDPFPTARERLDRGLPVDWEWLNSPVVDPPPRAALPAGRGQ